MLEYDIMNSSVVKERKRSPLRTCIVTLVLFLVFLCFFSARWYVSVYGQTGFDSILFTLSSSLGGVQSDLIRQYCLQALLPTICTVLVCMILLPKILFGRLIRSEKVHTFLCAKRSLLQIVSMCVLSVGLLTWAAFDVQLPQYIWANIHAGKLFEKAYVDPNDVTITFPEKKRNLVYIYLESMETSYLSEELGGALDANMIPELYQLAKDNTNFSHNSDVGGFSEASGASWTVGSMVSQTSGAPLKTPSGNQNDYGQDGSAFLPGITSLTSILADNGYYQTLMVGSDANFGGRKSYFQTHGIDKVYDIYTARADGIVPEDYFVWWGMEDLHLFEYAKQELTKIAAQNQPFAFTMLTVDTHHIGGYQCALCEDTREETYEQSISCSSRQVASFVSWLQEQPFYDNTTIIIVGDHNSMDQGYFDRNVDKDYQRHVYDCIINAPVQTERTKNRTFVALDMFPTTLAAIGCEIEGDRLGLGTNLFSSLPTLSEQMGFDKFNSELAKFSKYYEQNFYE